MAIGRLLSPKLAPHFSSRGSIPLTRRWFSSSLEDVPKFERLPDSEASPNKDIGQKRIHWYSLGGLLTNLKQKIIGNMLSIDKTSREEDSVSPKLPIVSLGDVTATKMVILQNVAENKICTSPSVNEESTFSETGSQDASQSGVEIFGETVVSTSVNEERLDSSNSLESSEFAQEKVLSLVTAERVEEPSSKDASLVFLTTGVLQSLASSRENQGKLQHHKGNSVRNKPPQNKLSNFFINPILDKEITLPLVLEELINSNSSMSTGESCRDPGDQHGLFGKKPSDPVQKIKNISEENDKHGFSDAIGEKKSTFSFESCRKPVVPVAVSSESSMKEVLDSLNSWNPNVREGKCISKGDSVMTKSDRFCAKEEEESKEETLVMQNQSLCSQVTLATTTANSKVAKMGLDALSIGEASPNKVLLRFLRETCEKKDIVDMFSKFGAVLNVQEIPSLEGCIHKDALLTFQTDSEAKEALKKGVVMVKNRGVVVEATSQEDMVEKICIPDLIGDPDVPIALVKEPTRTVKIHPLPHDISSNQIKEALSFCRSNVSKFILGASKTAAFVEFETEDGKERALAEHSISIFDKQFFISRIDIPRTTVARISNLSKSAMKDIRNLCGPYGQIKDMYNRGKDIADVHFDVSEWPNMLTILNSMNGKEIDGTKWVARPATTVIPPEILKVLWEDPQEKRYVKSVIQNLVREIEQPLDATRGYTLVTDLIL